MIVNACDPTDDTTPFNVNTCPLGALIVAAPVNEIALPNVTPGASDCNVTPLSTTEPLPKAVSLLTLTLAPALIVVTPVITLAWLRLYVPVASNTKFVAVIAAVCVIAPVPVNVTVVPLIGALIVMLFGSILSAPPAWIAPLIVMLFAGAAVNPISPLAVRPVTPLAVPTTKSVLLCKLSAPNPAPATVPNVLAALDRLKLAFKSVSPYPPALTAPVTFTVFVPLPPNTVSEASATPPTYVAGVALLLYSAPCPPTPTPLILSAFATL